MTRRLAGVLGLAALLFGCGKPTPEKACAQAAKQAAHLDVDECIASLKSAQEADETRKQVCSSSPNESFCKEPGLYETKTKCLSDAPNEASIIKCVASDRHAKDGVATPTTADLPDLSIATDTIERLIITNANKGEVILEKKGSTWEVTKPAPGPANDGNVKSLLANLKELRAKEQIAATASADDKTTYEFDPAHAVHVIAYEGSTKKLDIAFGKSTARGQTAMVDGKPGIYSVSGYSGYLYTRDPKQWSATPPCVRRVVRSPDPDTGQPTWSARGARETTA